MVAPTPAHPEIDLDGYIAPFEAMQEELGQADLGAFLPDVTHADYAAALRELVRVDIEYGWRRGCPTRIDEYLARFPALVTDFHSLQAIAFEEYRQRASAGEPVSPLDYQRRFGFDASHWPGAPTSRLPRRDGRENATTGEKYPRLGEEFLGFRLIRELGQGAFAKVYLARQGELADRPVALKISAETRGESKILARLQHGNIVPIHSVHRHGPWQAICMPYLGSTTLRDVLLALRGLATPPTTGKMLADTVRAAQLETWREGPLDARESTPDPVLGEQDVAPVRPNNFVLLDGMPYLEASLWIGKRLAAGLEHAHERGVLHRDLKPANVLLSEDGEPMLLDFNLSEDARQASDASAAMVGGTLPYMAPEQLLALRHGTPAGDKRSDLYSLGVILFELLTGQPPFPTRQGMWDEVLDTMLQDRLRGCPRLDGDERVVTPAVRAIVARCLASNPADRYASAQQLHDDLDRQLRHLPLLHTKEPSWRERIGKWTKRHPRVVSASSVGLAAAVLLLLGAGLYAARGEHVARLEAADNWRQFERDVERVQVASLAAPLSDRRELDATTAACQQALQRFPDEHGAAGPEPPRVAALTAEERARLRDDRAELLFVLATVECLRADFEPTPAGIESRLKAARRWNERAREIYAGREVPDSLRRQERFLRGEADRDEFAPAAIASGEDLATRSVRDICQTACWLVSLRRYQEALPLWRRASLREPRNLWAWFGLGNCYEQTSQPAQAAACYSACIALNPDFSGWYFNRGRMNLQLEDYAAASDDFSEVLRREPRHDEARVNLALALLGQRDFTRAVAELRGTIERGHRASRTFAILAQAEESLGHAASAREARELAEREEPHDEAAWVARGVGIAGEKPEEALVAFDRALEINPRYLPAIESKAHMLSESANRTEEAVSLLDRAVAWYPEHGGMRATRGVLLARLEKRDAALADAGAALSLDDSPAIQYQVAGIHARLSSMSPADRRRALRLLATALRRGYGGDLLAADGDLDSLRMDDEFQKLLEAARALRSDPLDGALGKVSN